MYEKVVAAALAIEGGTWGLAYALVEEIPTIDGRVAHGEWPNVLQALTDAGVTASNGEQYSERWLRELREVAEWTLASPLAKSEPGFRFSEYPFKRVQIARRKTHGDHAQALALLQENKTMHEMAGTSPAGTAKIQPSARDIIDAVIEMPTEELERAALTLPNEKRKKALRKVDDVLLSTSPAFTRPPNPNLAVNTKFDFVMEMAGALTKLNRAAEEVRETWNQHIDGANPDSVEVVRDSLHDVISSIEALTADWSGVT